MRPPLAVITVDLAQPIVDHSVGVDFIAAQVVFRVKQSLVGTAVVPIVNNVVTAEDIIDACLANCTDDLLAHLQTTSMLRGPGRKTAAELCEALNQAADAETKSPLPQITVAICTRDRPADLQVALDSLTTSTYANFEVIVVDNAPSDDQTQKVLELYEDIRHVVEPRPGLNWARTRAVLESKGEIVAFLDDDAVAEPVWLGAIGAAFAADKSLGAVTGPVLPSELDTDAQMGFEEWGGFSRGFRRRWFGSQIDVGAFGTGANMAFRRSVFDEVGFFDPALDVGTPTGGGGDLDMFWRVVSGGYQICYEPEAVVWHRHRRDFDGLTSQLSGYGAAVGSYLSRIRKIDPTRARSAASARRSHAVHLTKDLLSAALMPSRVPTEARLGLLKNFAGSRSKYAAAQSQAMDAESQFGVMFSGGTTDRLLTDGPTPHVVPRGLATIHIDIDEPLTKICDLTDIGRVHVMVRSGDHFLGQLYIENRGHDISRLRVASEIASTLATDLIDHSPQSFSQRSPIDEFGNKTDRSTAAQQVTQEFASRLRSTVVPTTRPQPESPKASIVLATLDRPHELRRALKSLSKLNVAPDHEIVVVDNNPSSGDTPPVVGEFPLVRLVSEPRRGLAYARNAGIKAAQGEIIVCTDDDVTFTATWLEQLLKPFARRDVMAVCGRVLPLELETESQVHFENYGGLDRGSVSWVATEENFFQRRRLVPTWDLGATANAAFRRSIFANPEMGPFEESLGPGTPSGVGEDTYVFYRILQAGHSIAYEADAWVLHKHRKDPESLERQLANYTRGQVCYQLTTLIDDSDLRALHQLGFAFPRYLAKQTVRSALGREGALPLRLRLRETAEFLTAPPKWFSSRLRAQRLGRTEPEDLVMLEPEGVDQ